MSKDNEHTLTIDVNICDLPEFKAVLKIARVYEQKLKKAVPVLHEVRARLERKRKAIIRKCKANNVSLSLSSDYEAVTSKIIYVENILRGVDV